MNGADPFLAFIRNQQHLSKVTGVTKEDIGMTYINEFISGVLEIPNLREFQLFLYDCVIKWTDNWSTLLLASKVQHLRLMSKRITFESIPGDSCPSNHYLKSFAVRVKEPYSTNIVSFLKSFPSLKDLCLSHVNRTILESVCTNQVRLVVMFSLTR